MSSHIYIFGKRYYDVQSLWLSAEKKTTERLYTLDFFDELLERCWDEGVRPIESIEKKQGEHWTRCEEADLSYAILVGPKNEIIDGRHRLTKLFAHKIHCFDAKVFASTDEMAEAEIFPLCPECGSACFITTINPDSFTCRDMGHWLGDFDEVQWGKTQHSDCLCKV